MIGPMLLLALMQAPRLDVVRPPEPDSSVILSEGKDPLFRFPPLRRTVVLPEPIAVARLVALADTPVVRPRAIEYSDSYYMRLTIHR